MEHRATQTAVGPMTILAIDQAEQSPLLPDPLAYRVLPAGVRALVTLTRWRRLRRAMINAMERQAPGMWASFLCRKRYIDDQLRDVLRAGVEQVVILGAGFDTLAYRHPDLVHVPVFEVDLPENIERKRTVLCRRLGTVPDHVTLVAVDFQTQDLAETLLAHGYRPDRRTFVVWEAVTQYLTEPGVRRTLDFLATTHPGSRLVFTYIRRDFLDGHAFYGAEALHREYKVKKRLWHFGLDPDQVADLLAEYGWREVEHPGPQDFVTRYLTPTGRSLPVSPIERWVSAVRR